MICSACVSLLCECCGGDPCRCPHTLDNVVAGSGPPPRATIRVRYSPLRAPAFDVDENDDDGTILTCDRDTLLKFVDPDQVAHVCAFPWSWVEVTL